MGVCLQQAGAHVGQGQLPPALPFSVPDQGLCCEEPAPFREVSGRVHDGPHLGSAGDLEEQVVVDQDDDVPGGPYLEGSEGAS